VLGVNTNTILRALRILRDEGLIEMGRGRAITVTGTPGQGAVQAKIRELLELARYHGCRRDAPTTALNPIDIAIMRERAFS
jgi:GntR family transcriptional regulator